VDRKKKKQIIFAVICLAAAVAITAIFYNPFGGGSGLKKPVQMLCVKCGASFEITSDEYEKQMTKKGAIGPKGPTGPPPGLKCPKCGQEEAYTATKCKKCGKVFFPNPANYADFLDRCPECGYSAKEEKYKRRQRGE
jgi:DNA-directed RNA polymerase subunit M/transcription elongation factor TFIIS